MCSQARQTAEAWIGNNAARLSEWTATIFDFAEPAWREYRSAAWYVERLRAEGFTVEEGSGGMPTAFCAHWSNGPGPVVGLYAEYDAVPANCQKPAPEPGPRPGVSRLAAGHTDPHSALGIAALGGALALKAAMERHAIPGGIRFTGEPAEKVRGSKPIHAAAGYYDGLAGIFSFHPFYMLPYCNTVRWDTHCGAALSMIYRFACPAPEAWGSRDGAPIPQSHADIRAPGANDALVMMYAQGRMLRDSMLPHRGGWSVSEAILSAGQATADNLPGAEADIQYMIRAADLDSALAMADALDRLAATVAQATGTTVERHWVSRSRPGLANHAMAELVWAEMQAVGAPVWSSEGYEAARAVQAACGVEPAEDPFLPECHGLIDPREAEERLRRDLPPSQANFTSDDYTEMCWHAPTARFYIARPALNAPRPTPAWAMNALGGMPATIDPTVTTAARVLARAALRLIEDGQARRAAWSEFERRTGGGPGGSDWLAPLCDYPPPIGFAWPEYVETPRGRDWYLPG